MQDLPFPPISKTRLKTKIVSLDIETTGLDFNRDRITCVGMWCPQFNEVHRDLPRLRRRIAELLEAGVTFVGHNLSFDLKFLWRAGIHIPLTAWAADTNIMAAASVRKPTKDYLERYEALRKKANAALPHGVTHRPAGAHSLKTLAPFWLGVAAFWETPGDHDNDEYVLKDCEYTYRLYETFVRELNEDEWKFAQTKLMRWAKTLVRAEWRGVRIDERLLDKKILEAEAGCADALVKLEKTWSKHFTAWRELEVQKLTEESRVKAQAAVDRLKDKTKEARTRQRYYKALHSKIEKLKPFNMNSDDQMAWLLRDQLGLDITRADDGKESTDASVLKRLAKDGNVGVKHLLTYRKHFKLASSFYPSYKEMQHRGRIHTSFNISGTRTGRLSSSGPNLQQVPADLHTLFIADEGHELATFDQGAIEAKLIAEVTCDLTLLDICNRGLSIHDYNTKHIFFEDQIQCDISEVKKEYPRERKVSKTVGFALFYGAGWKRIQYAALSQGFHWSEGKCRAIHRKFKKVYEGVFIFKKEILDPQFEQKKPVLNLLGRPIYIADVEDVYMKGFNTFIQSSASDLVLDSATRIQDTFDYEGIAGGPALLVHDEVVTQFPSSDKQKAVDIIRKSMLNYPLERVKLEIEGTVGSAWIK